MIPKCPNCGLHTKLPGICPQCRTQLHGLCTTCPDRSACSLLYRSALCTHGYPPVYPPCTSLPLVPSTHRQIRKIQLRTYGLDVVGVVPILLAAETRARSGADTLDRALSDRELCAARRELEERWGLG